MSATILHPAVEEAYGVLATGTSINLPLATRLAELPGSDVLDLISLAHKVRLKYAPGLHACSIVNAKSGACPENCRFCAQSAHHAAQVPEYGLLDPGELKVETADGELLHLLAGDVHLLPIGKEGEGPIHASKGSARTA